MLARVCGCFGPPGGADDGAAYKDLDSAENVLRNALPKPDAHESAAATSADACALKQAAQQLCNSPSQNRSQDVSQTMRAMTADLSSYVESSVSAYQTIDSSTTDGQFCWDATQQAQRMLLVAAQHASLQAAQHKQSSQHLNQPGGLKPDVADAEAEVTAALLVARLSQHSETCGHVAAALEAARQSNHSTRYNRCPSSEPLELPTIGALVHQAPTSSSKAARQVTASAQLVPPMLTVGVDLDMLPGTRSHTYGTVQSPPSPSNSTSTLRPSPLGRSPDTSGRSHQESIRRPASSGYMVSVFAAPSTPSSSSRNPAGTSPQLLAVAAVDASTIHTCDHLINNLQPSLNVMAGFHSVGATTPYRPMSTDISMHSSYRPSHGGRTPHRNNSHNLAHTYSNALERGSVDRAPRISGSGNSAPGRNSLSARNSLSRLNSGLATSYMLQRGLQSPVSSSCGNQSLARLLGVDDVALGDMETPDDLTLLPLDDFSAMDTAEIEELLAAIHNGDKPCNLLAASPRMPTAMRREHWALEDYALMSHLHHGYVSDVVEGRCKRSGARVALKVYSLPEMPSLHRVQLLREIRLHLSLDHPNVVRMHAAFMEQGVLTAEVGRGRYNHVVLVQEFAEHGDLLALMMAQGGRLSERRAVNDVLRPLLASLAYCHSRGIVHRDLKPGNVLFGRDWQLKLADFGLSLDLNEERANTRAGTLEFMAPEVLKCPTKTDPAQNKFDPNTDEYSTAADAWGIGALFYSTIAGQPPFKGANHREVAAKIMDQEPGALLKFPERMTAIARDFVIRCMRPNPLDRPTVMEMQAHPLLSMYAPSSRPTSGLVSSQTNVHLPLEPLVEGPGNSATLAMLPTNVTPR